MLEGWEKMTILYFTYPDFNSVGLLLHCQVKLRGRWKHYIKAGKERWKPAERCGRMGICSSES